jgi:hypothetical protein
MVAAIWIEALCISGAPARSADAEASQIGVYGHLPSLENLALSPDGTREDERNLYVKPLNENKVLGAAHVGDVKLWGIECACAWTGFQNLRVTNSTDLPACFRASTMTSLCS